MSANADPVDAPAVLRTVVGMVVLIGVALAVLGLAGVDQRRAVVTAVLRAVVQLALVAAALRGVFAARSPCSRSSR